jgi:hypothetical protein
MSYRIVQDMDEILAIVAVVLFAAVVSAFAVWACWSEATADTIVIHDGSQSYACEVSRIHQAPHRCKPIEDTK